MSKILTEGKKSEEKASDFIFRMNAKTIIEKVLRKINLTPFPEVYFSNSCNINFNKKGI